MPRWVNYRGMSYLAPNRQRKKIRLKAKNPDHEAAGLRKRHYGMNNELLSAETPEGNRIGGNAMRTPERPASSAPSPSQAPAIMAPPPAPVKASGGGFVSESPALAPPKQKSAKNPGANGPQYSKSKLSEFYADNPHLERGKASANHMRSPNRKKKDPVMS